MFNLLKKKETEPTVLAPCDGRIVPLEQVKDATFSQKMMGDGFAVMPAGEYIVAPFKGTVLMVFPTLHTFDILDRVGGGDSFTAGVLHGLISDMKCSDAIEFATCASVLKHSIIGDINMVDEKNVTTLMKNGVGNINR